VLLLTRGISSVGRGSDQPHQHMERNPTYYLASLLSIAKLPPLLSLDSVNSLLQLVSSVPMIFYSLIIYHNRVYEVKWT